MAGRRHCGHMSLQDRSTEESWKRENLFAIGFNYVMPFDGYSQDTLVHVGLGLGCREIAEPIALNIQPDFRCFSSGRDPSFVE